MTVKNLLVSHKRSNIVVPRPRLGQREEHVSLLCTDTNAVETQYSSISPLLMTDGKDFVSRKEQPLSGTGLSKSRVIGM